MRLDLFLVKRKLAVSRTQAQDLIKSGHVFMKLNEQEIALEKSNQSVTTEHEEYIFIKKNNLQKYVSRAGQKLESAVQQLKITIQGKNVLDVGQSTGGFTDFLLQNGAAEIVGFDVGHHQLHEKLKSVSNISFFEGLHVKDLSENLAFIANVPDGGFDLIVMDVSFISISKVFVFLKKYLKINGEYLFLVKPQFELTATDLDRNGIVKDKKSFNRIKARIEEDARLHFGTVLNYIASELSGKDGNQEFFIYGQKTI